MNWKNLSTKQVIWTVNIFKDVLTTSLSIVNKGIQWRDVDNLSKMWISLIANRKNFDNFCMPLQMKPTPVEMGTELNL